MSSTYSINIGKTKFFLLEADITKQKTDVIVNAANSQLMGGGGVDGAIHKAAGSAVMIELKTKYNFCSTGDLVVTGSGNLHKFGVKYIFHAVGPIWGCESVNEAELLSSCYKKSILKLYDLNLKSISFPSISTGIYGYPIGKASRLALKTVIVLIKNEYKDVFEQIIFVLFTKSDFDIYFSTIEELLK